MDSVKQECVCCHHLTPHRIIHRESNKEFPFCLGCKEKDFYNIEIFWFKSYRESPKEV